MQLWQFDAVLGSASLPRTFDQRGSTHRQDQPSLEDHMHCSVLTLKCHTIVATLIGWKRDRIALVFPNISITRQHDMTNLVQIHSSSLLNMFQMKILYLLGLIRHVTRVLWGEKKKGAINISQENDILFVQTISSFLQNTVKSVNLYCKFNITEKKLNGKTLA